LSLEKWLKALLWNEYKLRTVTRHRAARCEFLREMRQLAERPVWCFRRGQVTGGCATSIRLNSTYSERTFKETQSGLIAWKIWRLPAFEWAD